MGEFDEQASRMAGSTNSSDEIEMTNRSSTANTININIRPLAMRNDDIDFGQDNLSYHY